MEPVEEHLVLLALSSWQFGTPDSSNVCCPWKVLYEPQCKTSCIRGFRQGLTQTTVNSKRRWLEAQNFGFRKKMDCTIYVRKTKAPISCAVTMQQICAFAFAYAKSRFSHEVAHITSDIDQNVNIMKDSISSKLWFQS